MVRALLATSTCLALAAGTAAAQCELEFLVPPGAAPVDEAGWSVAVSGERVLVGSPLADRFGPDSGTAYVFERAGSVWTQAAELVPSAGAPGDWYGTSVALSGDTAVVGSDFSASAFVFERGPSGWVESAELLPLDPPADGFGRAVAVDGATILVGAFADDDVAPNAGSVYLFERSPSGWAQADEWHVAGAKQTDWIGSSVAVSGGWAVVGAPGDDLAATDGGAAWIFRDAGSAWVQDGRLEAGDPADFDRFGSAVDLDGSRAVVGAGSKDAEQGAAYVFEHAGTSWSQVAKLTAGVPTGADRFGHAVAVSGDAVAVGAHLSEAPGFDQGAAYLFRESGGAWGPAQQLTASDGEPGDWFGVAAGLDGDRLALGALLADAPYTATGAAYVWTLGAEPCPRLFAAPDAVSTATGGAQALAMEAGPALAGQVVWVLGSATGTSPGFVVDGTAVPLNVDGYYLFLVLSPNTLIAGSLGVLDGEGRAAATALLPELDPDLVGVVLHHAWIALSFAGPPKLTAASNPEPLRLLP